ncbi:MAG: hypothetical protein HY039_04185 [Nitrospirae bacterium]|nr:hypothetical protein [Nitrospirota bacterium]
MKDFTRRFISLAVAAAGALAVSGCGEGNIGAPAFTGATPTITLTVDPSAIPADGSSTSRIKARVVNGSQTVNFTTTLGKLSYETRTAVNGEAEVVLTSDTTTGKATVRATSGSTSATVDVTFG